MLKFARLKNHATVTQPGQGGNALPIAVEVNQPVFEPAESCVLLHTLLNLLQQPRTTDQLVVDVIREVDRWEILGDEATPIA